MVNHIDIKHEQHYVPRYRYRFFNDSNKKHYQFLKNGKYLGYRGVGNSISVQRDLYESSNGEYEVNELENYLGNQVEKSQSELIKTIVNIVASRNVLNCKCSILDELILPKEIVNRHAVLSFMHISLFRLPNVMEIMKERTSINRLYFFQYLDNCHRDDDYWQISILYTEDDNVLFILPDNGMICGLDNHSIETVTMPITPYICLVYQHMNKILDGEIVLRKVSQEYVKKVNGLSICRCNEKFISRNKCYEWTDMTFNISVYHNSLLEAWDAGF